MVWYGEKIIHTQTEVVESMNNFLDNKKAAKPHFADYMYWQPRIRHEAINSFLAYKKGELE